MLTLRLPQEIDGRLDAIAKKTGRTKSFLARVAIIHHLDDLEDYHLALARLRHDGKRMSLDELEAELEPKSVSGRRTVCD